MCFKFRMFEIRSKTSPECCITFQKRFDKLKRSHAWGLPKRDAGNLRGTRPEQRTQSKRKLGRGELWMEEGCAQQICAECRTFQRNVAHRSEIWKGNAGARAGTWAETGSAQDSGSTIASVPQAAQGEGLYHPRAGLLRPQQGRRVWVPHRQCRLGDVEAGARPPARLVRAVCVL